MHAVRLEANKTAGDTGEQLLESARILPAVIVSGFGLQTPLTWVPVGRKTRTWENMQLLPGPKS